MRYVILSILTRAMHSTYFLLSVLATAACVVEAFDLKQHLGNLSPQFTPSFGLDGGLGTGMPNGCSIQQIQVTHRHGSRFPLNSDYPYIANLSSKLNDPSVAAQADSLDLPAEWKFIQGQNRWSNALGLSNLTATGRKENFDDGVKFRLAYPDLSFEHIAAGDQDRVLESAQWFRAGAFGRYQDDVSSLSLIEENNVTISAIASLSTCPNWITEANASSTVEWAAVYLPPIQKRINGILKPVELTTDEVHGALYACAYEISAFGNATWCNVFTQDDFLNFEYELDLLMRSEFGYGLPGNMGPVLGSVFANQLIDRLTATNSNQTYIEFGHDTSITIALTGLGLAADESYPASGPPNPSRNWRSSKQVPFAAHMVWEKWNCGSSTQVRLLLNGAPFSLAPICAADKSTGACLLDDLVKGTEAIRSIKWGDSTWNSTCGDPGF